MDQKGKRRDIFDRFESSMRIRPRTNHIGIHVVLFLILVIFGNYLRESKASGISTLSKRSNEKYRDSGDFDIPLKAGGFPAHNTTICPVHYVARQGQCWIEDGNPYLLIQNKFMECFDVKKKMKTFACHRVSITAYTGDNPLLGNVIMPNITIKIAHNRKKPVRIMTDERGRFKLKSGETLELKTSMLGKISFSLMADHTLDEPIFYAYPPFTNTSNESIAFLAKYQAIYEISKLTGQELKNGLPGKQPVLAAHVSDQNANVTAEALQRLLSPLLQSKIVASGEFNDTQHAHLTKRSLQYQDQTITKIYTKETDVIAGEYVVQTDDPLVTKRIINPMAIENPFELRFDDDEDDHQLIQHSAHSIEAYKATLRDSILHFEKRSYFSELKNKAIQAGKSLKNFTLSIVKGIPNAFGNSTGKGKYALANNLKTAWSNVTKLGLVATRDVISILPFGDTANDKLGINELVNNITSSNAIIVTPMTFGIELFVYGPKTAFKTLITSIKQLFVVISGILKRVGATVKAIFEYVKATFNWDDILMNHRLLSSHFGKMIPFIRTQITSKKGNFSQDIYNTLNKLGDVTEEATSLFINGNLTSLANLIGQTNQEMFKNITKNQKLETLDVQSSLIADQFASSLPGIETDISAEDKDSFMSLTKQTMSSLGEIVREASRDIKTETRILSSELSKQRWNISAILNTSVKLFRFSIQLLLDKVVQAFLVLADYMLTLVDKILSAHIRLPFITSFYQNVVTRKQSKMTFYDLFALGSAIPLTVAFKGMNDQRNLFTKAEADVILATDHPEYYVDNLVAFAMQFPNRNSTALRGMYRRTVSFLLGSGYAAGQLFSALVGFAAYNGIVLYFMRAPFDILFIMCNYPWSWYTETLTKVGVNARFISWAVQFIPFFIGWPNELVGPMSGINWFSVIALVFGTVPVVIMVVRVWLQDLALFNEQLGPPIDGASVLDVTMKGLGRLAVCMPQFFFAFPIPSPSTALTIHTLMISGAALQNARLYIDIANDVIYSV